jgi:hypothetical protein
LNNNSAKCRITLASIAHKSLEICDAESGQRAASSRAWDRGDATPPEFRCFLEKTV